MTPCEKLGYKVGDRFEVVDDEIFTKGGLVELASDNGTSMPMFKGVDCMVFDGARSALMSLERVRTISQDGVKLQPGDYVLTEGMDEATYRKVEQKFLEAGAEDRGDMHWKKIDAKALGWDSRVGELWHCSFVSKGFNGRQLTVAQVLGEDGGFKVGDVVNGGNEFAPVAYTIRAMHGDNVWIARDEECAGMVWKKSQLSPMPRKTEREKAVEELGNDLTHFGVDHMAIEFIIDLGYRKTGE